jgi:hypothetical protein
MTVWFIGLPGPLGAGAPEEEVGPSKNRSTDFRTAVFSGSLIAISALSAGQSPYRYVSARRLERENTLVDIALSLSFSRQANFTRAFKQAIGQAPGQYRQTAGSRRSGTLPMSDNLFQFRREPASR